MLSIVSHAKQGDNIYAEAMMNSYDSKLEIGWPSADFTRLGEP